MSPDDDAAPLKATTKMLFALLVTGLALVGIALPRPVRRFTSRQENQQKTLSLPESDPTFKVSDEPAGRG